MNELNATATAISSLPSVSGFGIIIGVIVFISIVLTIFLISKNFRKTLLGSFVTGSLLGIFFFSKWVGSSASQSNLSPFKWTLYVIGFIVVSGIIGHLMSKNKKINRWLNN